jgi:hypothetical protein
MSDPTGVTGWEMLGAAPTVSGGMSTTVYTKVAQAGDADRKVTVTLDLASKYTMTIAAYSGDMLEPTFAAAAETVNRPGHTTPTLDAPDGAWVLSSWADKSSTTTAFVLPGVVAQRTFLCGTSTGHICSALADSDGPVTAGTYGGLTATADSSQLSATMWTLVLRPVVG